MLYSHFKVVPLKDNDSFRESHPPQGTMPTVSLTYSGLFSSWEKTLVLGGPPWWGTVLAHGEVYCGHRETTPLNLLMLSLLISVVQGVLSISPES